MAARSQGLTGLMEDQDWPFRQSLNARDCRYARLQAKSPTYGAVTVLESNAFRGLIAFLIAVGLAGYALWGFTLVVLGVQTIYGSFFLSMLGMTERAHALRENSK